MFILKSIEKVELKENFLVVNGKELNFGELTEDDKEVLGTMISKGSKYLPLFYLNNKYVLESIDGKKLNKIEYLSYLLECKRIKKAGVKESSTKMRPLTNIENLEVLEGDNNIYFGKEGRLYEEPLKEGRLWGEYEDEEDIKYEKKISQEMKEYADNIVSAFKNAGWEYDDSSAKYGHYKFSKDSVSAEYCDNFDKLGSADIESDALRKLTGNERERFGFDPGNEGDDYANIDFRWSHPAPERVVKFVEYAVSKSLKESIDIDPYTYAQDVASKKEVKNDLDNLTIEYARIFDEMCKYNSIAKSIYPGFDEDKAESKLSKEDYAKYKDNLDKYNKLRKDLRKVYDKIESLPDKLLAGKEGLNYKEDSLNESLTPKELDTTIKYIENKINTFDYKDWYTRVSSWGGGVDHCYIVVASEPKDFERVNSFGTIQDAPYINVIELDNPTMLSTEELDKLLKKELGQVKKFIDNYKGSSLKEAEEFNRVSKECPMCDKEFYIDLTKEESDSYELYKNGIGLIQEALPDMEPIEREFLKSGYCPECQDLLFNTGNKSTRIKEYINEDTGTQVSDIAPKEDYIEPMVRVNTKKKNEKESIKESTTSINDIEYAEPNYSGGGIYLYTGKLKDGNYFLGSDESFYEESPHFMLRVVDEDPNKYEEDCWFDEWQQEHLVKDLTEEENREMTKQILHWVVDNKPDGNYQIADMKRLLDIAEPHELEEDIKVGDKISFYSNGYKPNGKFSNKRDIKMNTEVTKVLPNGAVSAKDPQGVKSFDYISPEEIVSVNGENNPKLDYFAKVYYSYNEGDHDHKWTKKEIKDWVNDEIKMGNDMFSLDDDTLNMLYQFQHELYKADKE